MAQVSIKAAPVTSVTTESFSRPLCTWGVHASDPRASIFYPESEEDNLVAANDSE